MVASAVRVYSKRFKKNRKIIINNNYLYRIIMLLFTVNCKQMRITRYSTRYSGIVVEILKYLNTRIA